MNPIRKADGSSVSCVSKEEQNDYTAPLYPSPTIERISLGVIVAVGIVGLALSAKKPWIIM